MNQGIDRDAKLNIVWLGAPVCQDLLRVGGKVANLSSLAAKYRVPPGLCLTTAAYAQWVAAGESDWPEGLRVELESYYSEMAERCGIDALRVAVRSSAIDEDGRDTSFAGLYETYLNVVGIEALAAAVVGCWISIRSSRVIEYRHRCGLPAEGAQIAVLVQQMVQADMAGIAFSANPVTKERSEVVINSSWGLGESIVDGSVTPDTYIVAKAHLVVRERQIAEKERMTIAGPEGTREVAVPRFMRAQSTLDDAKAVEIARLALLLEVEMGWPVDLEYAYQGETLYLLQCRPITTLD